MSNEAGGGLSIEAGTDTYEPPVLTPLGNARELLAGETGIYTDAIPDPINPGQDHP